MPRVSTGLCSLLAFLTPTEWCSQKQPLRRELNIRQVLIGGVNKDWPVPIRVRTADTHAYICPEITSYTTC